MYDVSHVWSRFNWKIKVILSRLRNRFDAYCPNWQIEVKTLSHSRNRRQFEQFGALPSPTRISKQNFGAKSHHVACVIEPLNGQPKVIKVAQRPQKSVAVTLLVAFVCKMCSNKDWEIRLNVSLLKDFENGKLKHDWWQVSPLYKAAVRSSYINLPQHKPNVVQKCVVRW